MKKGLQLPTNAMVMTIIAVVIITVLLGFVLTNSGQQMSNANAQKIFSIGCNSACSASTYENYKSAIDLSRNNPDFMKACEVLGYGNITYPNRCLEHCGCDMKAIDFEVNETFNNIIGGLNKLNTNP